VSGAFRIDFLVVGAQRGGTTALARFLEAHPDVCVAPAKELHVFDDPALFQLDWGSDEAAERLRPAFPNYAGQARVGEASPTTMYLPGVAERVRRYNPRMKLVFLLREPAERAVSHYAHSRRHRAERLPFPLALLLERRRLRRDRNDFGWESSLRWHSYTDRGQYARQIREMASHFSRDQMLFLRTEELAQEHDECLRRVFRFLEVDVPGRLPPRETLNATERRCWAPAFCRQWVARRCYESTLELERITGWDLSGWKRVASSPRG
jgi:hypothetical protein